MDALYGRAAQLQGPSEDDRVAAQVKLSDLNEAGYEAMEMLRSILLDNGDEINGTEIVTLISLVNRSLAEKRGNSGSSLVSAEAV